MEHSAIRSHRGDASGLLYNQANLVLRVWRNAIFYFLLTGLVGVMPTHADEKPLTSGGGGTNITTDSILARFPDDNLYTRQISESNNTRLVVDFRKSRFSGKTSLTELKVKNMNGKDGFSPAGPVLFEVSAHPDKDSLPASGGPGITSPVKIFNMATGEEVNTSIVSVRADDGVSILYIYPESAFASGKHIALITKGLHSGGAPVRSSPLVQVNWNRSEVMEFLSERGITLDNLVDLKTFTVASKNTYLKPVNTIVSKIQSSVPAFCKGSNEKTMQAEIKVMHKEKSFRYHKASGNLAFQKFFNTKRSSLIPSDKTRYNCVSFTIFYPRFYKEPGPVLLFGHPLSGSVDSSMKYIYPALKQGYAVIAIDFPYHGSRGTLQINYENLLYIFNQGAADMLSLSHALNTTLSSLDLFPKNGKADFDQSKVSYLGISFGAIAGQLLVARGNVKSAYFKTGGVNIGQMFSVGTSLGFFRRMIIPGAYNKQQEAVFLAVLEDGFVLDGIHYMDNITPHSLGPKTIGLEIMKGDTVIDSRNSLALKKLLMKNPATSIKLETFQFRDIDSHALATGSMKFYPFWLKKQTTR